MDHPELIRQVQCGSRSCRRTADLAHHIPSPNPSHCHSRYFLWILRSPRLPLGHHHWPGCIHPGLQNRHPGGAGRGGTGNPGGSSPWGHLPRSQTSCQSTSRTRNPPGGYNSRSHAGPRDRNQGPGTPSLHGGWQPPGRRTCGPCRAGINPKDARPPRFHSPGGPGRRSRSSRPYFSPVPDLSSSNNLFINLTSS